VVKSVGGAKNGKTRTVSLINTPKYYPADDVKVRKVSRKSVGKTSLKANITPGSVLILLSGRFAGKRVVFLKQLDSGLLLVTGPFKINGVPLKRVDQAYVIGTSAKVDVSGLKLEKFTDAYFAQVKDKKAKATEKELFGNGEKKTVDSQRLKDQKEVDTTILTAVKKVTGLKSYLNASFALGKGELPHLMKF
jgi:large subunit ribosomal protein L6e